MNLSKNQILFMTPLLFLSLASPDAPATEILSCTATQHMHKHVLTVHLDGQRVVKFDYEVNLTQVPAGNDFCLISGDRNSHDLVWKTEGRQTIVSYKNDTGPKSEENDVDWPTWRVRVEKGRDQLRFYFDGRSLCGPSAVHAREIVLRKNSKRCELVDVAE